MNINRINLERMKHKFSEKQLKRLQVESFNRLVDKLDDIENPDIDRAIANVISLLDTVYQEDGIKPPEYLRAYKEVKKDVRKTYGYVQKGTISSEYVGIGVSIGVAFGAAFTTINPAFIGIGIPIGIAIGAALGNQKESEAEKDGKVY